jgi:steroid delta-isomerase-like uncharacterized protein
MSCEENIQLMRRWFDEVWNQGRVETIFQMTVPDVLGHGQGTQGEEVRGPEAYAAFHANIRSAFSELELTVEDMFGCEDRVVTRWSATMKHTGDGLGFPPTGRDVTLTGIAIARFKDGKIVEGWDAWDQAGMLRQLETGSPSEIALLERRASGSAV